MRSRLVAHAAAAAAIGLTAAAAWSSGGADAAQALQSGVVISSRITPHAWLVDDTHQRVFVATTTRLVSFSLGLTDRHAVLTGRGDARLFMPPDDSDVFVMKQTKSGWQLNRFDPVSLVRTGLWSEPGIDHPLAPVWSRGRFWTVVQRPTATGQHYVLASLDPNRPGRGWRVRLDTACGLGAYLVAAPAGHWVACVRPGTWGAVYLYRIGTNRVPTLVDTSTDIQDLINGPSFAPDGATAVMNEPAQTVDAVQDGFYTADTSDLATATHRWITTENFSFAAFTPTGDRIVAVDHYGFSFFFDAVDAAAPPEHGAYIYYDGQDTYGIRGVIVPHDPPVFAVEHHYMYVLANLLYSGPATKASWTYHLVRYPIPT